MEKIVLRVPLDVKYCAFIEGIVELLKPMMPASVNAEMILKLRSVLNEAFVNVVKHSQKSGDNDQVQVEFHLNPLILNISFSDTGKGIKLNGYYPPYPEEMIGERFLFLETFDGFVHANVIDNSHISLNFEEKNLESFSDKEIISKAKESGLGISMITKIMDNVEYVYSIENKNQLFMKKQF